MELSSFEWGDVIIQHALLAGFKGDFNVKITTL